MRGRQGGQGGGIGGHEVAVVLELGERGGGNDGHGGQLAGEGGALAARVEPRERAYTVMKA